MFFLKNKMMLCSKVMLKIITNINNATFYLIILVSKINQYSSKTVLITVEYMIKYIIYFNKIAKVLQ
jgi:hypothetical protein